MEAYHAPRTSQTRRAHLCLGGACPRRSARRTRPLSRCAADSRRPQSQSECDPPACLAPVSRDPTAGGSANAAPAIARALRTLDSLPSPPCVGAGSLGLPCPLRGHTLGGHLRLWLAPWLVLSPGLPQSGNDLRRQGDPPRPAWGDLQPVEFARLAPIGNRVHRHVEESGCRLGAIAPITSLTAGTSGRPQRAATLQAISITQPIDLAGRKRTALTTAVPLLIETLGNPDIGMIPGQLLETLDHLRRRTAHHISRCGPRHFQRTTRVGVPAHIHAHCRR